MYLSFDFANTYHFVTYLMMASIGLNVTGIQLTHKFFFYLKKEKLKYYVLILLVRSYQDYLLHMSVIDTTNQGASTKLLSKMV